MSNQIRKKEGQFTVKLKHKKPYIVGFFDGEHYTEFIGFKSCMQNFMREIFRKKYRGFKIFPYKDRLHDITYLHDYLKKRKFTMKTGFIEKRCIFLKLYMHLYKNKNGSITHSNTITFLGKLE